MTSPTVAPVDVAPLYLTSPPRVSSAGQEAAELAASAGLHLDPWQVAVLDVALGERADGKWAALEVGLLCPRQNGKGSILEALELAALFLFGERTILHSAHEFKTAGEAFLRIKNLIEQTPDLMRLTKRFYNSHGQEGIELRDGARLRFVARSKGSGRGFSADRIIIDEAYNLSDLAVSALIPTMAARENPQIWYTSSAPLEEASSDVLRRLAKRGREGDGTLAFMEFCAPDDADLDDPKMWAMANPGYPGRINSDLILMERGMMLDVDFARERLGIWHDPLDTAGQVIPAEKWSESINRDSALDGTPVIGLEVSEDRAWSSFVAAGKSSEGALVHGEFVDYKPGTDWVVARAAELQAEHGCRLVVRKGSPAASLLVELEKAGVTVTEVSTEEHAQACGQLFDRIVNGGFVHRDEAALNYAVRHAVRRDYSDAWVWSQKRSSVDISPLVALTTAAFVFGQPAEPAPVAQFVSL